MRHFCIIHKIELEYEHHFGRLWCNECEEYIDDPLRMYIKLDQSEVLVYDKHSKQNIIENECHLDEYVSIRRLSC